jgi:hypothetical protein
MLRGSVLAVIAQVLVGSSVAVLGALRDYPLYLGQGLRYGLALLMIAAVLAAFPGRFDVPPENPPADGSKPRLQPNDYVRLVAMALTGMVGFNLFVVAAERRADPALVGVIVGGAPIMLALLTPLLARRIPWRWRGSALARPRWRTCAGSAASRCSGPNASGCSPDWSRSARSRSPRSSGPARPPGRTCSARSWSGRACCSASRANGALRRQTSVAGQ